MKKLILLLLISSCGYAPIDRTRGIIITDIESNTDNTCDYYGKGNFNSSFFPSNNFKFIDTCGKFQIGDTLFILKR